MFISNKNAIKTPFLYRSTHYDFELPTISEQKLPTISTFEEINEEKDEYDPFQIPPDIDLAIKHGKAKKLGIIEKNDNLNNLCKCCHRAIEKKEYKLFCDIKQLAFLGCAYPLYFYYMKQIIIIFTVLLILGGSIKLTFINYGCDENCISFYGFAVLNLTDYAGQILGQSGTDTLISVFLIISMFILKNRIFHQIQQYNDSTMNPRDFTIMAQNLPNNVTHEELKEYFQNLVRKEVIKVNFAYDISEYKQSFKKKLKICKQIKKLEIELEVLEEISPVRWKNDDISTIQKKIEVLENEIDQLDLLLENHEKNPESTCKFVGTAFITFNSQVPVRILLEQWGCTLFRNIEFILLRNWRSPYLKLKGKTVLIHEAPDPTDLIWSNLDFSVIRDVLNYTVLYFLSGGILLLSFYVQFIVVRIVSILKEEAEMNMEKKEFTILLVKLAALSISSLIIGINFLLRITVYMFSTMEKLYSNTKFNQSYINIYILLTFFNSALTPYLVHSFIYSNKTSEQLIWDIHFILLSNSFSFPIFKCFDPFLYFRKFMRYYIIKNNNNLLMTQHEVNYWFEGPEMDIAENYAYLTRTLLLCCWYSSVAPLGLIFGIMGLGFNYWIDKFRLLRINAFPQYQTEQIIYKFINNLEILPYLYMFGAIEYHSRIVISLNLIDFIWGFIFYGISSFSMTLCLVIYLVFFKYKADRKNINDLKYNDIKFDFITEYDRENPITQGRANKEFVASIKESKNLKPIDKKNLINKVKRQSKMEILIKGGIKRRTTDMCLAVKDALIGLGKKKKSKEKDGVLSAKLFENRKSSLN